MAAIVYSNSVGERAKIAIQGLLTEQAPMSSDRADVEVFAFPELRFRRDGLSGSFILVS